ncbi:MAG: protease pro-enzyme activation domain-containing protein [Acidobacteriota bacterium]|nr:protease pro-enzyme activation domain-containing protein [Acidobacteriota bacterium]
MALAKYDVGAVPDSTPAEHVVLLLQRTPEQDAAAAAVVDNLHNPNSSMYHQWLTPEQFGQHFGPSDADVLAVTNWLQQQGFTVEDVPPGRTHVTFSGTAGQMKAAFGVQYHTLNVNGEKHVAVLTDPKVPTALAPVIAGFRNLHDWSPKPNKVGQKVMKKNQQTGAWEKVMGPASAPEFTFNYSGYNSYDVTPQDWYTIYNSNPLYAAGITGAGVTIAVIEETGLKTYSSSTGRIADVDSFRSAFGLAAYPAPANATAGGVNYINGPGNGCAVAASPTSTAEEGEALLDVEWAGAVAPNAIVDFVACNSTGSNIGTYGTDLAASYIANYLSSTVTSTSLSYGECETSAGTTGKTFYTNIWQQMSAEGITPVVSSGDAGSAGCNQDASYQSSNLSTSTMSSTAYNISAGGTDFSDFYQAPTTGYASYWGTNSSSYGSALSYIPEISWGAYCANPLFVSYLQYLGNTAYTTNYTPEYLCASNSMSAYRAVVGGSGGISVYNTIPSWQSVYGVGTGTVSSTYRNEPDLSFFASSGWWSHALSYCQSDSGYACSYGTTQDAYYLAAGGTSFVAPQINGLMALVNQQYGRQGQANYTLYKLGTQQYGPTGTASSTIANCSGSKLGNAIPSTCVFHDIANDTPCINGISATMCTTANGALAAGEVASDIVQSCKYTSVTNCYRALSSHTYGLSAVGSHTSTLAYRTAQGYDLATGLGSANVYNLVTSWNNAASSFTTTTALAASSTTLSSPTDTTTLTATVTATQRGGVPAGTVAFYIGSTSGTELGTGSLVANTCTGTAPSVVCTASATLTVAASALQAGSNSIIAYFQGDGANDAPSTSSAVAVTAPAAGPATITTPATGSTLSGTSTTITWSAGGATSPYYIWVGSTSGAYDLVNVGPFTGTSTSVTLPENGATVYVTLWSTQNGSLVSSTATYTEATSLPAALSSPASGSTLSAASATFTWTANQSTTPVYLWVGSTAGGFDLVNVGPLTGTSTTVTLPTNGATVYATLWSTLNGTLTSTTATYTEASLLPASISSPASGSTLSGTSTTFTWAANGSTTPVYLWVGSTAGGFDLVNIGPLSGTSTTVTLPANGATVYATLWSTVNGTLVSKSYTYTEATFSPAAITSPANGSTLASTQEFDYSYNQSTDPVYIWVGSTAGGLDIANLGPLSGGSAIINLPTDGAPVYVTLWSTLNGSLTSQTYVYTDPTATSISVGGKHASIKR